MKIAIFRKVIGNYSETFVRRNIDSLNNGQTVVVGMRWASAPAWKPKQPTLILGKFPKALQPALVCFFLRIHGVQAAVLEFLDFATEWAPLLRMLRIPFISLGHGYDIGCTIKQKFNHIEKISVLQGGRKILVPCNHAKTILLKRASIAPDFIECIPVGIDLSSCANASLARATREIAFIGRFVEKKSPFSLLLAFHEALKENPDIILHCIGDGPLLGAAKNLAKCLGIESHVVFYGSQPHSFVLETLKNVRCLIQHSVTAENGDIETMPLSAQEALACGTPAIVTSHAGLPDIVTHDKSGYLVEELDYIEMGGYISKLLRLPPDQYLEMQRYGIEDSLRFDCNIRLNRIHELLGC
jgi:colanic acid/amylovoran biosynthesis glycosyltransferase